MRLLKKLASGLLAGLLAVSMLAGCGDKGELTSGANDKDYPVTVNGVTLKGEPAGVAVLSPNIADAILAMSYEICLKAKSAECTQSDLEVLPNVTVNDAEAIQKTGADLVLVDEEPSEDVKSALNKAGVNVIAISPAVSREDLERFYGEVGAAIKGGQTGYTHGQNSAQNVFYTMDDIERVIPETNVPVTACYLLDASGGAATGDQLAGKLIEMAGLVNAANSETGGKASLETIQISDPQYIFCPTGVKSQLEAAEGYKDLTAVKEGRVFEMDPSYMAWQGNGMVQAVIFMAGTVYPELSEGVESSEPPPKPSSGGEGTSSSGEASSSGSGTSSLSGETLKKGDTGDAVMALQKRLDELGYMFLPCTGEFGDGTEQAVKDFQYLNGMESTGIADPETIARINSSDAKRRTS